MNNVTLDYVTLDKYADLEIIGPFSSAPAKNVLANSGEVAYPTLLSNSGKHLCCM